MSYLYIYTYLFQKSRSKPHIIKYRIEFWQFNKYRLKRKRKIELTQNNSLVNTISTTI